MAKKDLATQLRKEIDRVKGPADRTVIRFNSVRCHGAGGVPQQSYTYAAVYVASRWYVTGPLGFHGVQSFTHADFVSKVLNDRTVEHIEVATDFDEV